MSTLVVYWIDPIDELPRVEFFPDGKDQLTKLLNFCAEKRKEGMRFVTSAGDSEQGAIVRDGKLPNGEPYTWTKRRDR